MLEGSQKSNLPLKRFPNVADYVEAEKINPPLKKRQEEGSEFERDTAKLIHDTKGQVNKNIKHISIV